MAIRPFVLLGLFVSISLTGCEGGQPESKNSVRLDSTIANIELLKDSAPQLYPVFKSMYTLEVQLSLSRLGFGPSKFSGELDAATREATRSYEQARGLPITGNPFAATTYSRLNGEAARVERLGFQSRGAILGKRFFLGAGWQGGYIKAEGPWVAPGVENPAAAVIECFRDRRECTIAEAEYGIQLIPVTDRFQIQVWDDVEIRSRPVDDPCKRSVLRILRVEQSVSITRSALSNARLCSLSIQDTSVVYNHTSHLATDEESDSIDRQRSLILFDSLINVTSELRSKLAILRDTAALRAAVRRSQ